MTADDVHAFVTDLFRRLRGAGFGLGVSELLDGLRLADDDRAKGEAFRRGLRLLWCKSVAEGREFDLTWLEIEGTAHGEGSLPSQPFEPGMAPGGESQPAEAAGGEPSMESRDALEQPRLEPAWRTIPWRSPLVSASSMEEVSLFEFLPVSRRKMVYAWRRLRRPVADGPADVLDVAATVDRAARQGFYLAPVYGRRKRNHARLLLLLDHGGSMVPFHRLTRELAETAAAESDFESVDVYYFHNVPGGVLYLDPFRTRGVPMARVLGECTNDTGALIVSDAGAARRTELVVRRLAETVAFLGQMQAHMVRLAWLNPLPPERWRGSTAGAIARSVPMFAISADGLARAIDVVRDQYDFSGN